MQVVNLVSWAGDGFSCNPGEVIDLPDDVAAARIDAGLAEALPPEDPDLQEPAAPPRRGPGRPRKVS